MNKERFFQSIEELGLRKMRLRRQIAKRANVHFMTVTNYFDGFGSNPDIMENIINAAKEIINEKSEV